MAISTAVYTHNHGNARINKFKPIDLFFNTNDSLIRIAIENIIKSQKIVNNNRDIYRLNSFSLISEYYNKNGNIINIKLNKKGKKIIPGIFVGKGSGYFYTMNNKNYYDLEKDHIYDIDFLLVIVVNEIIYNKIIKEENVGKNLDNLFEFTESSEKD